MKSFRQLLLFELTEEERQEIAGMLEFDYGRFPKPDVILTDRYTVEVEKWLRRSRKIDRYIEKHFKLTL